MTPQAIRLRIENSLSAIRPYLWHESVKPSVHTLPSVQFVEGADGEFSNFIFQGQAFYGEEGAKAAARGQLDLFTNDKKCFHPPVIIGLDEDSVWSKFARQMETQFGARHMFDPYKVESDDPSAVYDIPAKLAPMLMVFGLGLGYHIEQLIDHFDIGYLIVVETEAAVMTAAMAGQSWTRIVQKLKARGIKFTFIYHPDGTVCCFQALNAVRDVSQTTVVGVRIFAHYSAGQMTVAREVIPKVGAMMSMLAGYFTDEFRQVKQARDNLATRKPVLSRKAIRLPDDHMAMVVGAGPSLDDSYDLIRQARDQIYLISCGTALEALLKNGVNPDAHVELETHPSSRLSYKRIAGLDIPVLLPVSFDPPSAELFPHRTFFLRDISTSTQMFGGLGVEAVAEAFAVTGNAGAALAVYLGFPHVMLIGMDCGLRPDDKTSQDFHASGTAYEDSAAQEALNSAAFEGSEQLRPELIQSLCDPQGATPLDITSIDGRPMLASPLFAFALSTYNKLVENNPDRKIYQVSHGAMIRGAINAFPEDMQVQGMHRSWHITELIERCLPRSDLSEGYAANSKLCAGLMARFGERSAPMWAKEIDTPIGFIRADQAFIDLQDEFGIEGPEGAALSLLRVSSCTFAQSIFQRALLITNPDDRARWLRIGWKVLGDLVNHTIDEVVKEFGDLSPPLYTHDDDATLNVAPGELESLPAPLDDPAPAS